MVILIVALIVFLLLFPLLPLLVRGYDGPADGRSLVQSSLRSTGRWNGVLHPNGSGTKDRWITFDRYGSGPKPSFRGADNMEIIAPQGQRYWII